MLPYILKICFILYNLLFILPFPGPEKVERYAATGLLHIDQMVRHNLYSCSISFLFVPANSQCNGLETQRLKSSKRPVSCRICFGRSASMDSTWACFCLIWRAPQISEGWRWDHTFIHLPCASCASGAFSCDFCCTSSHPWRSLRWCQVIIIIRLCIKLLVFLARERPMRPSPRPMVQWRAHLPPRHREARSRQCPSSRCPEQEPMISKDRLAASKDTVTIEFVCHTRIYIYIHNIVHDDLYYIPWSSCVLVEKRPQVQLNSSGWGLDSHWTCQTCCG